MTRLSSILGTSAIAFGFVALVSSPAAAAPEPGCADSSVQGTECGSGSFAADDATAIGFNSTASGEASTALGEASTANGLFAVALGKAALAGADNAAAFGTGAQATGVGSTAIGTFAVAEGENSVAIGINANATVDATNSVALGANSVADQPNTVSVGAAGDERRIVNVAAGINATDAVNFSQLTTTNTALTTETNARIAGDAALNTALTTETNARVAADAALSASLDELEFDLDEGLRDNARDARAGTSAALAAAALPQAMDAGRTMVSGGVGAYRGRTAFAVGASHRLSTGSTVVKLGVTYDSSEHLGASAGFGVQF